MSDFDKYDEAASKTAVYPYAGQGKVIGLSYAALGLNGEAGEVAEKVKKLIRDKDGVVDDEFRAVLIKECGDVLWYMSAVCREVGSSLEEVAETNIKKLTSRKKRGVLKGSGDDR